MRRVAGGHCERAGQRAGLTIRARPKGSMYSRIAGTGSYLPEQVVTNFDLEKKMDTTDEWIRTRTGIERRHIAAEGQTTVDIGEIAARRAIEGGRHAG